MRLRRRRCLVCYWHEGEFVAHPYPDGAPVALHPATAEVLTAFEDWTTLKQATAALDHLTEATVGEAASVLREHRLLIAEDTHEADLDAQIAHAWRSWEPEAPFFHYATQDTVTAETRAQAAREPHGSDEVPVVLDGPLPAIFTAYPDVDRIMLPRRPDPRLNTGLGNALYGRRTHRDFTTEPVDLPTLATLLATCFAPVDYIDAGPLGALIRRTSPAGGARQELDAYLAITNVKGVPAGIYHYNSREHSLESLAEGFTGEEAAYLCAGQDWAEGAAFLVVLVAVVERMRVKYRMPRCYRVSLLNAGHLGQTFALTATALGLGPAQTGAFGDTAIARRLGIDNTARIPVYVLAAGHPHPEPGNAPPPADLDTFRTHRATLTTTSTRSVHVPAPFAKA
ncbi:SagB/ThcOx family dehydrogenase [Actinomadura oligospora]|uniref:SagB/ThcOx family dehydrogenase n=1 Tax=Actinomadura oligospora TaxID=111804 RepID=UPI0004B77D82|nr:SagB/ThcOx family dehydrogenase [Actinomadura oligospora]